MKKLKKSYFSLLLVLVCFVFSSSCKKDDVSDSYDLAVPQKNDIEVKDGYLSFKNDSVFRRTVDFVLKSSREDLDTWEEQFTSFKSYRTIFNSAQDEFEKIGTKTEFEKFKDRFKSVVNINPDTSIAYKIGTPLLSAIINKAGQFQIGETKYLINEEGRLIAYPANAKIDLNTLRNISVSDSTRGIKVVEYKSRKSLKETTISWDLYEPFNGVVKQELRYSNGRDRRLYIEVWRECIPVENSTQYYFNYYIKLLQESKKTFGGWGANKTDYTITDAQFMYQYITTYWAPPSIYTEETAPKVQSSYTLPDYQKNNFKGAVYIPLYSGTNWGSLIKIDALIYSGGVPHYNNRFFYANTYPR